MRILPCLLLLGAGLCLPCLAQRVSESYSRIELPTPHPVALAATSRRVVIADLVGNTLVASELDQWRRLQNKKAGPTNLWTFRDAVWGSRGNDIFELDDADQWQFRASITNLYRVREFNGMLYGLASPRRFASAVLVQSADGIGWEELSTVPEATHAYDFYIHEGQFLVTHIRGEYYLSENGTDWARGNTGISDRLYSAIFAEGRFMMGGTEFAYVSYGPGKWDAVAAELSGIDRLIHVGGYTFAAGGYNPDRGAISVSSDLYGWTRIPGEPIPSVAEVARYKDTVLFLSVSQETGVLSAVRYYPLRIDRIAVEGDRVGVRFETLKGFSYRLETSTDLTNWFPYVFPRPGTGKAFELFYPLAGERLYFRATAE